MGSGGAATDKADGPDGAAAAPAHGGGGIRLVGYNNFVRRNPLSDKFKIHKFHHVEFWCGDATNAYKR